MQRCCLMLLALAGTLAMRPALRPARAAEPGPSGARGPWKVEVPPDDLLWTRLFRPAVALSPNAELVAFAHPGRPEVLLINTRKGTLVRRLAGQKVAKEALGADLPGVMYSLAFSADRAWLIGLQTFSTLDYASNQLENVGCVNLWKIDGSAHLVLHLNPAARPGELERVQYAAFSPVGTRFAVAAADKAWLGDTSAPEALRVLPLGALVRAKTPQEAYTPVRLAFSPDGTKLAIGFDRAPRDSEATKFAPRPARVALWDLGRDASIPRLASAPNVAARMFYRIDSMAFSPDGKRVLVAGAGAWIWELETGSSRPLDLPAPYEATFAAGFDASGNRALLLGLGVAPYRARKGDRSPSPDPVPEPLLNSAWEARLVTVDLATGASRSAPRPAIRCADWNAALSTMAEATRDGTIRLELVGGK